MLTPNWNSVGYSQKVDRNQYKWLVAVNSNILRQITFTVHPGFMVFTMESQNVFLEVGYAEFTTQQHEVTS